MPDPIKQLVELRTHTHGDWVDAAHLLDATLKLWATSRNWDRMGAPKRIALTLLAHKVSRILTGNPDHDDHWDDAAGFAQLGKRK